MHREGRLSRSIQALGDTKLFAGLSALATGAMVGDWMTTYYGYYHPLIFREGVKATDDIIVNHGFLPWFADYSCWTGGAIAVGMVGRAGAYLLRKTGHPKLADGVNAAAAVGMVCYASIIEQYPIRNILLMHAMLAH